MWMMCACKLVIVMVSTYDTYLTIKYAEFLCECEQNPIARWLMNLDTGPVSNMEQIAAFVTAKFAGNLLVVISLQAIGSWRPNLEAVVAIPVTIVQLYLGYYLTFALK